MPATGINLENTKLDLKKSKYNEEKTQDTSIQIIINLLEKQSW